MSVTADTEIIQESEGSLKETKKLDEPSPKLSDACSVESSLIENPWLRPYEPPPVMNQSTVLVIGFLIFGLAVIWPPLILLV